MLPKKIYKLLLNLNWNKYICFCTMHLKIDIIVYNNFPVRTIHIYTTKTYNKKKTVSIFSRRNPIKKLNLNLKNWFRKYKPHVADQVYCSSQFVTMVKLFFNLARVQMKERPQRKINVYWDFSCISSTHNQSYAKRIYSILIFRYSVNALNLNLTSQF